MLVTVSSASCRRWSIMREFLNPRHAWKGSTQPGSNACSRQTCLARLRAPAKLCVECRQNLGGAGGAIVNVSSAAARLGSAGEYVDYAASKGAVDTFTVGLAREVAEEGIRVNAVRPGFIYTEMHASGGEPRRVDRVKEFVPMKRGGSADEVARAILWLLSDEASFTTGSFVEVSGGR
jgi:NAD(P)-dependent dehydrogenase (short-subunit alcohol dehydrogenase family)